MEAVESPFQVKFEQNNPDSDKTYWIIQNSWGRGWGIDGFMKIAIEDSESGIVGMNRYVQWMSVQ